MCTRCGGARLQSIEYPRREARGEATLLRGGPMLGDGAVAPRHRRELVHGDAPLVDLLGRLAAVAQDHGLVEPAPAALPPHVRVDGECNVICRVYDVCGRMHALQLITIAE